MEMKKNTSLPQARGIAKIAILLGAACVSVAAVATEIPTGASHQSLDVQGTKLEIFTYRPKNCKISSLLLVFHGVKRGAEAERDRLRPTANSLCLLEAAPLFDEERFPSWRYQAGGIIHREKLQPQSEWTGNLVLKIIDWVRSAEGQPALPYLMAGHSAGAQFLCRFAAFIPNEAKAILIANPGSYVLPTLMVGPPYGFRGVYGLDQQEDSLRSYLAQPVILILGDADVGDAELDQSAEAQKQGRNRHERGLNTFHAAEDAARMHGWPFHWRLIELPGIGHDSRAVFSTPQVEDVFRAALSAR